MDICVFVLESCELVTMRCNVVSCCDRKGFMSLFGLLVDGYGKTGVLCSK